MVRFDACRTWPRLLVWLLAPIVVLMSSCGGEDEESTVAVTLQEFAIIPAASSTGAGSVTFEATNEGPEDVHELVVVKTDLGPSDLPTNDDGAVNEDGEGIEVIGEIEEFPPGEAESGTFDLEAGNYVLICNIYDDDEQEAHYAEGMRTAFEVT
ncbi:MAG TPA: hypothetical protein VLA90_06710 [Actinomycetota bacterium]|nr:hypothetical protein [Actinomycetota bacterium]